MALLPFVSAAPYIVLIRSTNSSGAAILTALGGASTGEQPALLVALANAAQLLRDLPSTASITGASAALQSVLPARARRLQAGPLPPPGFLGFPIVTVDMSAEDAARLRAHPAVAALERDTTMRALGVEATPSAALDRMDQRALPLNGEFRFSQRGAGVVVFVLDSGIRATHTEFAGRVVPGANFAGDAAADDTADRNGHGTHVSSLCCGATLGVAQGAKICPVRIYDATNEGVRAQLSSRPRSSIKPPNL